MNWLGLLRRIRALDGFSNPLELLRRAARFRWAIIAAAALLSLPLVVVLSVALVLVVSAPVAAPVAVAGRVLGGASEVFGKTFGGDGLTGAEIAEAGRGSGVECKLQDVPDQGTDVTATASPPTPSEAPNDADPADGRIPATAENPVPKAPPIAVRTDGSISRDDAKLLVDLVPVKTSALTAHVWFLYRLGGIGSDWNTFITAYRDAGLRGDDESTDAPLAQVQKLNHGDDPIDGYRLTAASLAASGLYTGRFSEPHPSYRELLTAELMSSCMDKTGLDDKRMALPPAAVTSSAPEDASEGVAPEP